MSTAIRWSLPLAALTVLMLSCMPGRSFDFNGNWIGNRNLQIPNQPKDILYTAGRVTVAIKDNKFDLTEAGIPSSGTVTYGSEYAELHVESRFNLPLDRSADAKLFARTIEMKAQPDGTVLYDDPLASDGKAVKLVRSNRANGLGQ